MAALAAAIIVSIVLILRRPMSVLTKIQIILTLFVVFAGVVGMNEASWLHSMAYRDPIRQEWAPKLEPMEVVIWFGTIISWFLFTAFHVITVVHRKSKRLSR